MPLAGSNLRVPAHCQIHADLAHGYHGHLPRLHHLLLPWDVPTARHRTYIGRDYSPIGSNLLLFHVYRGCLPSNIRHEALQDQDRELK